MSSRVWTIYNIYCLNRMQYNYNFVHVLYIGYAFHNYLINIASHYHPPPLQSEGLVLRCPSSCNDSNSLMLMACLSLGPCWDHQPTSRGHSLAPGRRGPQTEETEEGEGEKREREGKRWF